MGDPKSRSMPAHAKRSIVPLATHDVGLVESPSVLVVDDDDAVRRLIVRVLRTSFTVYEARDGSEAAQMLDRIPAVACLVADVMMPGMDGITLAKTMRENKRLKGVPIIFVTGRAPAQPSSVLETINIGARHYIQKPFKMKDLLEKVRSVIPSAVR